MPNTPETIEKLSRSLERANILLQMKECNTLEEFKELQKRLEEKQANEK